jgi:hypothetical protein
MPDDFEQWFGSWLIDNGFDEVTDMESVGLGWGGENKLNHQSQSDDSIPTIDTNQPIDENYGNEGRNYPSTGGLMETFKNGVNSAGSWIKDNKELATMIGSGIAGAVRDKNQREMSQAQIDYMKQRQADLNASITPYDLGAALKRRGKA